MTDFSTFLKKMKRQIVNPSKKVSSGLSRPEQKFAADMCYGMLSSGSCLLTDVACALQETSKKVNTVERLCRHLERGVPDAAQRNYQSLLCSMVPADEVTVHIDNSDVVKPCGKVFEGLGTVRDGSKSSGSKCVFEKGFYVTEAVAVTNNRQPVSVFSEVWSVYSPTYISNGEFAYTSAAVSRCNEMFGQVVYVMDRGYDDNYVMQFIEKTGQKYVIRLKNNRVVHIGDKKMPLQELCRNHRGKYSMDAYRHGKKCRIKFSSIKCTLSSSSQEVTVIVVYGGKNPMTLVTNCTVSSKEDMIGVVKRYFSRWRIEEYFRCKKQSFGFENFRVRSLQSINALNFWLSVCMLFLASIKERANSNLMYRECIEVADPIKDEVHFFYYRLADGVKKTLAKARTGVQAFFKTLRPNQAQLHIRGYQFV
jgi:hypothetical protein